MVYLLVVIAIISLLMAILVPALQGVRRQALRVRNMSNQRQIVYAANQFALDNDNKYPESVATTGWGKFWGWQEPTMITGTKLRSPNSRRSLSAYLRTYLDEAETIVCPCAPEQYKYLQESWATGEDWDNPDTIPVPDPVSGTYCFYWNYTGNLGDDKLFQGPKVLMGGYGQSELLVSDYFGFDHWRSPDSYGSCELFNKASVTPGSDVSSAYFSAHESRVDLDTIDVKLHAGYTDGHVERYTPSETVRMKVSLTGDGKTPYPDGVGFGQFFLPEAALQ